MEDRYWPTREEVWRATEERIRFWYARLPIAESAEQRSIIELVVMRYREFQ